jgi:electron transfer flavoprotein alpha subunit
MSSPSFWRDLPVHKTLLLEKLEQVQSVCDSMILDYISLEQTNDFSYRILLPRNKENNKLAKKLGLSLQLEFTSQLRKRKLKTKMKEIRYIHDTKHIGWIITKGD